jgi:uncharacterized protein
VRGTLHRRLAASGIVALLTAAGCSLLSPAPDPSRFFVLTPVAGAEASAAPPTGLSVGLGPVTVPGYVNRAELVVRTSPNEVRLLGSNRWAEAIGKNVTQVLAQDLTLMLGTERLVIFPWYGNAPRYQVQVEVQRLEQDLQFQALLTARWEIHDLTSKTVVAARQSNITRPAAAASIDAGVAAMSAAIGELSQDIADALRNRPS